MMVRDRRFKRVMRAKKIRRKKSLIAHHGFTWYDCDGKYDKGKTLPLPIVQELEG